MKTQMIKQIGPVQMIKKYVRNNLAFDCLIAVAGAALFGVYHFGRVNVETHSISSAVICGAICPVIALAAVALASYLAEKQN